MPLMGPPLSLRAARVVALEPGEARRSHPRSVLAIPRRAGLMQQEAALCPWIRKEAFEAFATVGEIAELRQAEAWHARRRAARAKAGRP